MKKAKSLILSVMMFIIASSVYGQEPTQIGPGGNWTTARGIINTNMTQVYDSLESLRNSTDLNYSFIESHADSITAHTSKIALRLLKSDTTSMLANYTRNGELNSALAAKVNVSDTSSMLSHYALTSEIGDDADSTVFATRYYSTTTFAPKANPVFTGIQKVANTDTLATKAYARTYGGTGTVAISDVRDEIADSLNLLRPKTKVGDGTVGPFFDGTSDGGQILYFYGNNGFYTALQGGAPIANRLYRLPIAAYPSAGTTSLINIDASGNMGFVASTTYAPLSSPNFTGTPLLASNDTLATKAYSRSVGGGDVITLENRIDSIVTVLSDTLGIGDALHFDPATDSLATKAYARSLSGVTIGNVRAEINDSLDILRPRYIAINEIMTRATMGVGHGMLADTSAFVNGCSAGIFRWTGDSLEVTSVYNVLDVGSGTETLTLQIYWGSNYKTAVDSLFSSPSTITSLTGASITSFHNNTIPKDMTVWGIVRGISIGNRPSMLSTSIIGYIKRD